LVYLGNPVLQFSDFTNKSHQLHQEAGVYASASFVEAAGLSEGDRVRVKTSRGELTLAINIDSKISGDIAYLPTFESKINSKALFDGYRFNTATIERV